MPKSGNESALRVMILDDDPLDVKLIETTLRAGMDCRVTAVGSKIALLTQLWRETPDVVISDTGLPGFDGLNALKLMQDLHPRVPFVFCSGNTNPELRAISLVSGAKAWVPKDDLTGLVAEVKRVCGTPGD